MVTTVEAYEVQAGMIGAEHGQAAASWFFDGNTPVEQYEAVLRGIVECDPMVMDSLPSSPLSGEWADSYSLRDLADELGMAMDDDSFADACDAYEAAFDEAVTYTIEAACLSYLRSSEAR